MVLPASNKIGFRHRSSRGSQPGKLIQHFVRLSGPVNTPYSVQVVDCLLPQFLNLLCRAQLLAVVQRLSGRQRICLELNSRNSLLERPCFCFGLRRDKLPTVTFVSIDNHRQTDGIVFARKLLGDFILEGQP